jgi:hypothetical protein
VAPCGPRRKGSASTTLVQYAVPTCTTKPGGKGGAMSYRANKEKEAPAVVVVVVVVVVGVVVVAEVGFIAAGSVVVVVVGFVNCRCGSGSRCRRRCCRCCLMLLSLR